MEKLSWDEICKKYDQEWVHLIDYNWQDGTPYPTAGVVHLHAKERKELDRLMITNDPIPGARIYVGDIKQPQNILRMGCLRVIEHASN